MFEIYRFIAPDAALEPETDWQYRLYIALARRAMNEDVMREATPDQRLICAAFDRHILELHPAQFEVCKDSECRAARWIEESAQCYPALEVETQDA